MEQYVPEFSARDIDGQELLQMDGNKLKVRMRSSAGSERAQFIRNFEPRLGSLSDAHLVFLFGGDLNMVYVWKTISARKRSIVRNNKNTLL